MRGRKGRKGKGAVKASEPLQHGAAERISSWEVEPPHEETQEESVEESWERLAPSANGPLVARLVPPSVERAELPAIDLYRDVGRMMLGRSQQLFAECRINVASVSAQHCELAVNPSSQKVTIRDFSTNGTFLNGKRLKKGMEVELQSGDRVCLTNPAKASNPDAPSVEFIFQRVSSEIKVDVLVEELTCPVCRGLFIRPCSAIPCLHVCCAACISQWLGTGHKNCVQCRAKIWEVRPSHKIQSCVEELLKRNPQLARSDAELHDFAAHDMIPSGGKRVQKRLREEVSDDASNASSPFQDGDSSDSSHDTETRFDDFHAVDGDPRQSCRHCQGASSVDGFRCPMDAPHLWCRACGTSFPHRPLCSRPQNCQLCGATYCNLYYEGEGGCRSYLNGHLVRPQDSIPITTMPRTVFGGNTVERHIFSDYLSTKGIGLATVWRECMEKFQSGEWVPDIVCTNGELTGDSFLCVKCVYAVVDSLLFCYRLKVPRHELPESVTNRPNCWYGNKCRTQFHNTGHANRYNHVCYQVKGKE
ncbi:hypothetical protein MOQ_005211 [Trypanosoma cruzi marinkellei]|uniref:RING-type E3 ubiquitin transferase n=1 Tax=Trypanosoma cruzi marinkellei TaxID=85056 RepID=K2MYU2_TRYCR|nr:hypothetical protein MOQ_005211 [Trypanosoma cruzi marinkellei]